MRKTILLIILVLMATVVSADMRLFGFAKERYNLGDSLVASFSVKTASDFDGLFKAAIVCDTYTLEYFVTPLKLIANEQRNIDVTQLDLTDPSFVGLCFVKSNLRPFGNLSGEEFQSQNIVITEEIPLVVELEKQEFLPGENLVVSGYARTTHETFQGANLEIVFDDKEFKYPMQGSNFSHGFELGADIKSGTHTISISADDSFGNKGSATAEFSVIPVPTRLEHRLTKSELDPGEDINLEVMLYDQAGDLMQGKANTEILGPNEEIVFNAEQDTGKVVSHKFGQAASPGTYTITSVSDDLRAEDTVSVRELRQVSVGFDKRYLTFKNTGNVVYRKDFDVIIKNSKEYEVPVSLDLKPGELHEIDMFQQVPEGTYGLVVPKEDKYLVYEDVFLEDRRPLGKKTSMGLSSVTGALFGSKDQRGLLSRAPIIAAIVLIVIVAAIVFLAYKKKKPQEQGPFEPF